jgi:hypothetical protein
VPAAEHVPTTSTMIEDGPSLTPTMTNPVHGEAAVEGEVASRRETPRRVQVDHLASRIISDMNETILISLMLLLLPPLSPKTMDTHYLIIFTCVYMSFFLLVLYYTECTLPF